MYARRDAETIREEIDEGVNELSEVLQKIKEFLRPVEPLDPSRRDPVRERPKEFSRGMEKLDQLAAEIYGLCNEYMEAKTKP